MTGNTMIAFQLFKKYIGIDMSLYMVFPQHCLLIILQNDCHLKNFNRYSH